ncbi:MAG: UDP-2,4-diacetamido-2,4,6-trideoxy-beta-L-altropyranose hydrolase [Bacteroidota bacterium]
MGKKIVFRLDAGLKKGYGHLSRCMNLAEEFLPDYFCHFLVKTDDEKGVQQYIARRKIADTPFCADFIEEEENTRNELKIILKALGSDVFLVLDHYAADEDYQIALKQKSISWLQFDSHGRGPFYSDLVLHASPGATRTIYKPLLKNPDTRLLLGPQYAVLHRNFREARRALEPRQSLSKIFMSFGGGKSAPIVFQVLKLLDDQLIRNLRIDVLIGSTPESEELEKLVESYEQIYLHIGKSDVVPFMLSADLAIISPGTLSYEAACLGLPMLLIPFADNQFMNARGWSEAGCAVNAGIIGTLQAEKLNDILSELKESPAKIASMSRKSMDLVDGYGAVRVKSEIEKVL